MTYSSWLSRRPELVAIMDQISKEQNDALCNTNFSSTVLERDLTLTPQDASQGIHAIGGDVVQTRMGTLSLFFLLLLLTLNVSKGNVLARNMILKAEHVAPSWHVSGIDAVEHYRCGKEPFSFVLLTTQPRAELTLPLAQIPSMLLPNRQPDVF